MLASLLEVIPNKAKILTLLKFKCPRFDAILEVMLGGVLLPGVLDQTQWSVWDPEVSPASCPLSW